MTQLVLVILPFILHLISASPVSPLRPTPPSESCPPSCDLRECPIVSPDECAGQIVKDECQCCPVCEPIEYSNFYEDEQEEQAEGIGNYVNATHKELCSKIKCSRLQTCNINIQGIPMCRCPSTFFCRKRNKKDVCGEDDITYRSRCFLRMKECELNQRIRLKHEGPCFHDQIPKKQRKTLKKEKRRERLEEKRKAQENKRQLQMSGNKRAAKKEAKRQLKKERRQMIKKEKREERRAAKREEKREERQKLKNEKKQLQNIESRRELKKEEKREQNIQQRKEKKKRQRRRLRRRSKGRKNAKSKKNSDKLRRGRRCADEISNNNNKGKS